ncbi:hypothetical protein ACFFTM_02885 [Pseudoduganella plicata]|uniref:Uncharacterized protein n=1 Tax=Pseudoduganella plicata TaxID=321984 RepID=A0A4P7B9K2_9BURK|nr:hypothetical protein [Pseudoduganella plicata]QBQ35221.1 hypothetical protein E1742_02835 [Pseudoduganella plicata]GGZ04950.1 hypothetical protein GCM10007388_43150 [Pseudoduganella plicata]
MSASPHAHVLPTALEALIRLDSANIRTYGPAAMTCKATANELAEPASGEPALPTLPREQYRSDDSAAKGSQGMRLAHESSRCMWPPA